MGRELNKKVHKFFKFNAQENKSKCNVCDLKLAGINVTNLKRHLTTKHAEIFNDWNDTEDSEGNQIEKKRKICYHTSEEGIISSLVKIVTTEGKPFLFLDSEGFKEIMDPIYSSLGMNPVTSRNIMNFVSVKEKSIKDNIRAFVKGKLVSLKIDVATRMGKAILGVNLQMINASLSKTEIVVKTLGMIQLADAHTGMYMKDKILQILHDYEITLDQVFR